MSRRGWGIGLAALLALVEPRAADALETTPTWQADLGMLTSVTYSQNSRDPLPVLFADGTAVMLSGAGIDGAVPAVAINPVGVMSRTQSRLHVESQRQLAPRAVQARSAEIALVSLKVMQGTTSNGDVLVGIDRGGSVLWSRRDEWSAIANDDGSFWLAQSAKLERVAADGSRQQFVEVEAVEPGRGYLRGISGRGDEILVYGTRSGGLDYFIEVRNRASGALLTSAGFNLVSNFATSFTAMGDRLYSVQLRYEGQAANTYALAIETRSTSDGSLVGSVSIPSFSSTGAIVNLLPIADGGVLVVHADDGLDLVATRANGSLRWRQRMDRIDDPVFATSRDGGRIALGGTLVAEPATVRVHALDLQSGSLLASADFAGVGARARLDLDATDTGWVLARSRTEGLNRLRLAHDLAVQVDHQANGAVFLELASGATLVDDRLLVAREIATGGGRNIQVQAISPTDGTVLQDVVLQSLPLSAETRITQLIVTRFADGLGLHVLVARPWGEGPCPSLLQTYVLMLEPDTLQERWRTSMFEPVPTYLRGRTGGSLYLIGTNRDPVTCAALQSNVLSAWAPGAGSVRWSETTPQARLFLQDWPGQVLTTVDLGAQSEYELVMRSAVDGSVQWRSLVQNQDYPLIALDVQPGRVHTQEISVLGSTLALAARNLVDGQQSFRTVVDLAPGYPYFATLRATSDGRLLNAATRVAWRGQLRDASPYISVVNADDGTVIRTLDPGRLQGADWTLDPITRGDGRVPARSLAVSGVRSPHPVAHRVMSLATIDLDSGAIGGDRMLLRRTLPDYAPANGWARIDQFTELTDGSLLLLGVRYDALGVPRRVAARIEVAPVPSTNIRVRFPGGSPSTLGYDYVMDSVVTNTGAVRVDGVRLWSAPPDIVDGSLDIVGCSLNGAGSCPETGAWNGASLSLDVQSSMTLRVRYQCTSCTSGMPRDLRAVEFSATTPFGVAETDRADHLGRQLVTFGPFDSGFE